MTDQLKPSDVQPNGHNSEESRKKVLFDVRGDYLTPLVDDWFTNRYPILAANAARPAAQEQGSLLVDQSNTAPNSELKESRDSATTPKTAEAAEKRKESPDPITLLKKLAPEARVLRLGNRLEQEQPQDEYEISYDIEGFHVAIRITEDSPSTSQVEDFHPCKRFYITQWRLSSLAASQSEVKAVDLLGFFPEGTSLTAVAFLDDGQHFGANYFRGRENRIQLSSLDENSLGTLAHELGHAWHWQLASPAEIELHGEALVYFHILKKALISDQEAEKANIYNLPARRDKQDYLLDLMLVHHSERFASEYGMALLKRVFEGLAANIPHKLAEWKERFEKNWQTYDSIVGPSVGASELGRSVSRETKQLIWNFYWWQSELRSRVVNNFEAVGVANEETIQFADLQVTVKVGEFNILSFIVMNHDDQGRRQSFCFNFFRAGATGFAISPDGSQSDLFPDVRLMLDEEIEQRAGVLRNENFLQVQDQILTIMDWWEMQIEDHAAKLIQMLTNNTSKAFVDQFDPWTQLRQALELPAPARIQFDRSHPWVSAEAQSSPKRSERICSSISQTFVAQFLSSDFAVGKFDSYTGEDLTTSEKILACICRTILAELKINGPDELAAMDLATLLQTVYKLYEMRVTSPATAS